MRRCLYMRLARWAIARVNRLEADDPTLAWRPWRVARPYDPRRG